MECQSFGELSRKSPVNASFSREPVGHLNRTGTYTIDTNRTFDNVEPVPSDVPVPVAASDDTNKTFENAEPVPSDVQVEASHDFNRTFDNADLIASDVSRVDDINKTFDGAELLRDVEASHDKEADSTDIEVANITGSPTAVASDEASYHNIDEVSTSVIQAPIWDGKSPGEPQSIAMALDSPSIAMARESSSIVNACSSPPITVARKTKSPTPERFKTGSFKEGKVIDEKVPESQPVAMARESPSIALASGSQKPPTPERFESPPITAARKSKSPTPERFKERSIKGENVVAEKARESPAITVARKSKSPTPERFKTGSFKEEKASDEKAPESEPVAMARESKKSPTPEGQVENVYVEKEFIEKTTESSPIIVARRSKSPTPERFKERSIKGESVVAEKVAECPPTALARESKKSPTPERFEVPVENVYVRMENSFDVQFKKPALPVFKPTAEEFSDDDFKTCGSSCKKFKSLSEVCVTHKSEVH